MSEQARALVNIRQDRLHLRGKTTFVMDRSTRMLVPRTEGMAEKDFTVAKTPPLVKMMIVPGMEPEYFPEDQKDFSHWANWNPPTRTPEGKFLFAVGNNCTRGGKIFLYEYDPEAETVRKALDVGKMFGWTDTSHTDGKIHGRMGLMPDGTLWAGTQYGDYPPKFSTEKLGSRLFTWNYITGEARDLGAPLFGNTLALTALDTERGMLFATGELPTALCYDVVGNRTVFADSLPNGWKWFNRAAVLDEKGRFWSTDAADSLPRFLSYEPRENRFVRHELSPPENPYTKKRERLRAWTEKRAADGAFWCITCNGALFRFRPEKPAVEPAGVNWDRGRYTSTIALDPAGRSFYYMPGDLRMYNADAYGPIVRYDVKTGEKKVLAWLVDYYYEKYGYWVGGTYGMDISADGSFLVIVMNGAFRFRDDAHDYPYEYPALFVFEIPESER